MVTHTIAAIILEVAYLGTGLILCLVGQKLLIQGIQGKTKIEGNIGGGKWSLLTSSPGIVYAICGLTIIIYAIITPSIYEEKISSKSFGKANPNQISSDSSNIITSHVSSRLLTDNNSSSLLRSKLTLYAMNHSFKSKTTEDISVDINNLPRKPMEEPWSTTYQRFNSMLLKNPKDLVKILDDPEFQWIFIDKCRMEALITLLEIETAKL